MCIVTSCCCGFQTLQQGLFIFGIFDLLIRLVMLVLESWAGNSTLGIEGVLFMADVALAAGAKLEIRFLILVWLVIYGIFILFSLIVPPALVLIGWIFTQYLNNISGSNYYTHVLGYITNIKSLDRSRALFFTYHIISWFLGIFYCYIWICARSLYRKISPVTTVHILPGEYQDQKRYETRF